MSKMPFPKKQTDSCTSSHSSQMETCKRLQSTQETTHRNRNLIVDKESFCYLNGNNRAKNRARNYYTHVRLVRIWVFFLSSSSIVQKESSSIVALQINKQNDHICLIEINFICKQYLSISKIHSIHLKIIQQFFHKMFLFFIVVFFSALSACFHRGAYSFRDGCDRSTFNNSIRFYNGVFGNSCCVGVRDGFNLWGDFSFS